MIKQDDIIDVKIEKLVYEGKGLAHIEDKAVFVKGVLPDELVRIRLFRIHKNYIEGKLIEILTPSKFRIKPMCPYNKPCGACDFSCINYDYQIKLKENILAEIFKNFDIQFNPFIKSDYNKNYRIKAQFPTSETKNSKRVLIGYYKEKTHDITDIKFCPSQKPIMDEIANYIRENWKLGCYIEKKETGLLRHVLIKTSNATGDILLTLVLNSNEKEFNSIKKDIEAFSDCITKKFKEIKGVLVNFNNQNTNKITGDKTVLINGENFIFEFLEDKKYKTGALSFFQINPNVAVKIFNSAKNLINKKGTLLDLYGGVGTIGIFMKEKATKITLIEENPEAIKFAKENFKLNEILKYEIFEGKAEETVQKILKDKKTFDNIVIDPPRKGSDDITLSNISKMTNSLIYISCNPMTLKRDAETLIKLGFKFISLQGADMFPNTHHIECLAYFKKEGEVWKNSI